MEEDGRWPIKMESLLYVLLPALTTSNHISDIIIRNSTLDI